MPHILKGVSNHGPTDQCMVIGCGKKALYRCNSYTQRGYCSTHRDLAMCSPSVNDSASDYFMTRNEWQSRD